MQMLCELPSDCLPGTHRIPLLSSRRYKGPAHLQQLVDGIHTFLKRKSWDVVKSRITVRIIGLLGDPSRFSELGRCACGWVGGDAWGEEGESIHTMEGACGGTGKKVGRLFGCV